MVEFAAIDHGDPTLETVGGLNVGELTELGFRYTKNLANANVVFVHASPKEVNSLKKEWAQIESDNRSGMVFLRVSSIGGHAYLKETTHDSWEDSDGNVAYVLSVYNQHLLWRRNPDGNKKNLLKSLIEISPIDAKNVYEGWLSSVSTNLTRLFYRPPYQELLSSISILCQGFLALYSTPSGEPEDVEDCDKLAVSDALSLMGWSDLLLRQKNTKIPISVIGTPEQREARRIQVGSIDSAYWRALIDTTSNMTLKETVELEWNNFSGSCTELFGAKLGPVDRLLEALIGKQELTPGVVARAYIEIYKCIARA